MYTFQSDTVYSLLCRKGVCYSRKEYVQKKYGESAWIFLTAYQWFVKEAGQYVALPRKDAFPYWVYGDLYSFDAEVTLVDGASHTLANTEAVEAQIIDHMKYRAPENLFNAATSGDSFLGKLQGLFDLTERMSVTKDKLELTGGKEALFRSASDMITKIGNFNANVAAFAANPADPYQYLRELDERFTEIGNEYEIEPEETPAQTTEGDASSTQTSESEPSVTQENGGSKRDEQIEAARAQ